MSTPTVCPWCGARVHAGVPSEPAHASCPTCGRRYDAAPPTLAPIAAGLGSLVAILLLAIGTLAWGKTAAPFLIGAGGVLFAVCVAVIARASGRRCAARSRCASASPRWSGNFSAASSSGSAFSASSTRTTP